MRPLPTDREIGSVGELVGTQWLDDWSIIIVPDFAMDDFEHQTKNDGRDGAAWLHGQASLILRILSEDCKDSSGSIVDKRTHFQRRWRRDAILENPFEVDEAEDVDEINSEEMDDDEDTQWTRLMIWMM